MTIEITQLVWETFKENYESEVQDYVTEVYRGLKSTEFGMIYIYYDVHVNKLGLLSNSFLKAKSLYLSQRNPDDKMVEIFIVANANEDQQQVASMVLYLMYEALEKNVWLTAPSDLNSHQP